MNDCKYLVKLTPLYLHAWTLEMPKYKNWFSFLKGEFSPSKHHYKMSCPCDGAFKDSGRYFWNRNSSTLTHQMLLKIKFSKKHRHFSPPPYMKYICSSKKLSKVNVFPNCSLGKRCLSNTSYHLANPPIYSAAYNE